MKAPSQNLHSDITCNANYFNAINMYDYNQDYYVVVKDFSKPDRLRYGMGSYGSTRAFQLRNGQFNKPLKFIFDERYWKKGRQPEEIILYSGEDLIFKDEHKIFFNTIGQSDFVMHNMYFVTPDDEYIEGYWYIPAPEKPKEWLDMDASEIKYLPEEDVEEGENDIIGVRSYRFNSHALDNVDEKERQFFTFDYNELGFAHLIAHKNVMEYLKTFDRRNFKFIPLLQFKYKMSNQGPLPEFAF